MGRPIGRLRPAARHPSANPAGPRRKGAYDVWIQLSSRVGANDSRGTSPLTGTRDILHPAGRRLIKGGSFTSLRFELPRNVP